MSWEVLTHLEYFEMNSTNYCRIITTTFLCREDYKVRLGKCVIFHFSHYCIIINHHTKYIYLIFVILILFSTGILIPVLHSVSTVRITDHACWYPLGFVRDLSVVLGIYYSPISHMMSLRLQMCSSTSYLRTSYGSAWCDINLHY